MTTMDSQHIGAPDVTPLAPRRRRWPLFAALAVVLALAATGGGYLLLREDTFAVHGTLTIADLDGYVSTGSGCRGSDGYDDIHEGARVTVTDADGTVVAVGQLEQAPKKAGELCEFLINVPDVPRGKGFYGIAVGGEQRGTLRYPEAEVDGRELHLTLG